VSSTQKENYEKLHDEYKKLMAEYKEIEKIGDSDKINKKINELSEKQKEIAKEFSNLTNKE